jgi:diacylglycerol O-acyltransferase
MPHVTLDDAMFLLGETASRPCHVIALQLWKPPEGAGPDYASGLYESLLAMDDVKSVFSKHPTRSITSPSTWAWVDEGIEPDYHIRRAALPGPARVRELLETVSLQHSVILDRGRPLWEFHLYAGLTDGRLATTFKTHHALADGMSLARHTLGGVSSDADALDCTPPWVRPQRESEFVAPQIPRALTSSNIAARALAKARISLSTIRTLHEISRDADSSLPFEAPRSMFNVGIGGARRFAGDQWEHARFKAIAKAAGCSVNDVVLAVCGGALRAYMLENGALPDRSLIAMVPISVRRPGTDYSEGEGNAFGSILCDLGTTTDSAGARLDAITSTMNRAKERMAAMSPAEVMTLSRLIMGGAVLSAFGISAPRQPFNLIISNVPATSVPLYWNGAQMTDLYPISMISEGQAVNITVTRYAEKLAFGIVGDRKAVPHLQRMLVHIENAVAELEKLHG